MRHLLLLLVSLNCFAQNAKLELNAVVSFNVPKGLLVCGIDKNDLFKATIYGSNLSVVKSFTKQLSDARIIEAELKGTRVEFRFRKNQLIKEGSYLILTTELEEINSGSYSKEDYSATMEKLKKKDPADYVKVYIPNGLSLIGAVSYSSYIKDDLIECLSDHTLNGPVLSFGTGYYEYKGPTCVRRYSIKESKAWTTYKLMWQSDLKLSKLYDAGIIYSDEKVILLFCREDDQKLGLDHIISLDATTGGMNYDLTLNDLSTGENFFYTNSSYDPAARSLIVTSNSYDPKEKEKNIRMKDFVILSISPEGKIKASGRVTIPEYKAKEAALYNYKNRRLVADNIIKTSEGHYVVGCSALAKYSNQGYSGYFPVGFAVLEFQQNLNLFRSDISFVPEPYPAVQRIAANHDESKVMYWNAASQFTFAPGQKGIHLLIFSMTPSDNSQKEGKNLLDLKVDSAPMREEYPTTCHVTEDNTVLIYIKWSKELMLLRF